MGDGGCEESEGDGECVRAGAGGGETCGSRDETTFLSSVLLAISVSRLSCRSRCSSTLLRLSRSRDELPLRLRLIACLLTLRLPVLLRRKLLARNLPSLSLLLSMSSSGSSSSRP